MFALALVSCRPAVMQGMQGCPDTAGLVSTRSLGLSPQDNSAKAGTDEGHEYACNPPLHKPGSVAELKEIVEDT